MENLPGHYCFDKLDGDTFPLTYQMIDKYQWKDIELVDKLIRNNYHIKYFCGHRKFRHFVCYCSLAHGVCPNYEEA